MPRVERIVSGNLIGTNQDGTGALGNGLHGVSIDSRTNPAMSISITSDEPGAFSPDAAFLEDPAGKMIALRLRADRKADGDGRVYLIKVTATVESGNSAGMC